MYIEPQTNIKILHDVPLDSAYTHTVVFRSRSAQSNYFADKAKYNLTAQTYQRVKRGYARVGIAAEHLYNCNYMMWQNKAFGDKWFYAFITGVEYVNNTCSQVSFQIDVMQTWYFDAEVGMAYVDRQHSVSDYIGDNTAPEPVPNGNIKMNWYRKVTDLSKMAYLIAVLNLNKEVTGYVYDRVYSGAQIYVAYDSVSVNIIANSYAQQPDNIVAIYMCPSQFLPIEYQATEGWIDTDDHAPPLYVEYDGLKVIDTLNGYLPHNCKLYTYPYNYFHVDNGAGAELNLRYEYFGDGKPELLLWGCFTQPVQINLYPYNYGVHGRPADTHPDVVLNAESLQIANFPMCSWRTDSYQAWVAQNSLPIAAGLGISALGGAISGVASAAGIAVAASNPVTAGAVAGGAAMGALQSGLPTALQALAQGYQASIAADQCKGNLRSGSANINAGFQTFYAGRASLDYNSARIIDEFFDVYGYAQKRLMKVNRLARPHWTYVKTAGITITGSVPSDDLKAIEAIYDNGITFWRNASEVGNYVLDNRATQRGVHS